MINKGLSIIKNNFEEFPNNIEAEQSVIGTILVSNEIFDEINTMNKIYWGKNCINYCVLSEAKTLIFISD